MRDFYKYAAHLANPLLEQKNLSNAFFSAEDEKPAFSRLLEPTFQEICATYNRSIDKETCALTPSWPKASFSAQSWHSNLIRLSSSRHPIALSYTDHEGSKETIITRFVIFYAYRLRNKSWQVKGELDRSIRYFHMQGELFDGPSFDVLYWVKGDDSEPTAGDFISLPLPYHSIAPLNLGEIKTMMPKNSH